MPMAFGPLDSIGGWDKTAGPLTPLDYINYLRERGLDWPRLTAQEKKDLGLGGGSSRFYVPADPETIDRLIAIGERQNLWMLPKEGPQTVFQAYNRYGRPENPTRKTLQKRQKKVRDAILAERKARGPDVFHVGKEPFLGEWRLLRTEDEYRRVGDTFKNCVWWNHWFNPEEGERIYHKRVVDPAQWHVPTPELIELLEEAGPVQLVARPIDYADGYVEEAAIHTEGAPRGTAWGLTLERTPEGNQLVYKSARRLGLTQKDFENSRALRRAVAQLERAKEGETWERLFTRYEDGTATQEEDDLFLKWLSQTGRLIQKYGGLRSVIVVHPATVETDELPRSPGRAIHDDRYREAIEHAAQLLYANDDWSKMPDDWKTPVESALNAETLILLQRYKKSLQARRNGRRARKRRSRRKRR